MLVSAVRLVTQNTLLRSLRFIRFHSVPSLAHFSPYFSDSGSEDRGVDSRNSLVAVYGDRCGEYGGGSELSSSEVAEILRTMDKDPLSALGFFNRLNEKGYRHGVGSYFAVVKILCNWGLDSELCSLFMEVIRMKTEERSFELSELCDAMVEDVRAEGSNPFVRAFDMLIKGYVSLGMFEEGLDILFMMREHGVGPSLFSCNFLLNGLLGHGKFETVVALFQQLRVLGITPNVYTYGILVKAYSQMGCLEEAGGVFFEMEEAKVAPNAFTIAAYLEGLCRNGRSDIGYNVLQAWERENAHAPVDAYAYAVVIKGFVNEKNLHMAERVLRDLEGSCHEPNEMHYRPLIQGFCDRGDIGKALVIHDAMEVKGINTNCLILTSVLQCLCRKGFHSQAVEHFRNVREAGILLDEVSYNVAIDALCKLGKLKEAVGLFDEMKSKNLIPDVVHCTTLIRGICLHGDIFDARSFFREMIDNGPKPDVIAYDVLLGGLFRNGLTEDVWSLLETMKSQGVAPSPSTHNIVIRGLCSLGKVKEAEAYFDGLEDKGIEIYASMVKGYSESGNFIMGYKLFLWLTKQGLHISKNSRSKLHSGLCLEGRNDEAITMLEITTCCSPCYGPRKKMYEDLIASLCNAGDMERARQVFDRMIERGLSPDLITHTIMLDGYCHKNLLKEAHKLFSDMRQRGIVPDTIAYTVLLDGHCKISSKSCPPHENSERRQEKAKQVASMYQSKMEEMGLKPDTIYYTALIDSRCKSGNVEDAVSLFDEMIRHGLCPDNVTCTALISGYFRKGDVVNVLGLVYEMLSEGLEVDERTVMTLHEGLVEKVPRK